MHNLQTIETPKKTKNSQRLSPLQNNGSTKLLKMGHLRHRLRIFLFHRKVMFCSQEYLNFCIFNHSMIYQICDPMMSIGTWYRVHF